jgi:hypothetical protein
MGYVGKKPADIIATAVDTTTGQFSGTLGVTGETTLSANLNLGDNDKAIFGADDDLQIYHDVNNSIIADVGTGNLQLRGTNIQFMNGTGSQTMAFMFESDAVQLRYNNVPKLTTTSSGIEVTGNIANTSGDLTLDVAGDIILDADDAQIRLSDGGTQFGLFGNESSDFVIQSSVQDKDIMFQGNDGGVGVTALTLDMSNAGTAIFNHDIKLSADAIIDVAGNLRLDAESANIVFQDTGTVYGKVFKSGDDFVIKSEINNGDIVFQGFYDGSTITALTLNMGIDGAAQFKDRIQCTSINTGSSAGTLTMYGGGTNKGGTIELSGGNNTGSTGAGIVFKTGASTSSPSEKMRIDQYGHVTMPSQPAFSAKVTSQQSNIAPSSQVTVLFATELYDQNSDYNNSTYTFTAPVTGKYQLNVLLLLDNLDTGPGYYQTQLRTSNRVYYHTHDPRGYSQDLAYHNLDVSILADMDAGDTAYVTMYQAGGVQQTDIDAESYFTGHLVC